MDIDVIVVGAGPAGLSCAVELARLGVGCRVVDQAPAPRTGTRCPTLWPRTLEVLSWIGAPLDALLDRGVPLQHKVFHVGGETARISAASSVDGRGYQFPLVVGQDLTEAALTGRLRQLDVQVEYGTAATVVAQDPAGVDVILSASDRPAVRAGWLVLATGAEADPPVAVPDGGNRRYFAGLRYLCADVRVAGADVLGREEHIFREAAGHAGLVPLPDDRYRLSLTYQAADADRPAGPPDLDQVMAMAGRITGLTITDCDQGSIWTERPQAWLASSWQLGRCLLLGDAAKHFPIPVHGLNTAVEDGFNLAWKLAAVIRGDAAAGWLASFSAERQASAAALLRRTEKILGFGSVTAIDQLRSRIRRGVFELRGEPAEGYPPGPLVGSVPARGAIRAGAAPPNLRAVTYQGRVTSVFDMLCGTTGWTLLLLCAEHPVPDPVYRQLQTIDVAYPGRIGCLVAAVGAGAPDAPAGLALPMLCLVRPDGYLAFHSPLAEIDAVRGYISTIFDRPGEVLPTTGPQGWNM